MEISTLINLSINDYAFYWSLPELIGIENGLIGKPPRRRS